MISCAGLAADLHLARVDDVAAWCPRPASNCSQETAGGEAVPSGERPMNSIAIAIVLAVYWPPQAPWVGQAWSSISLQLGLVDLAGLEGADRLVDGADRRLLLPLTSTSPGRIVPP